MKNFIEYIAERLTNRKQILHMHESHDEKKRTYELYVNANDIGKVIGKYGCMADAMRTIVDFYGQKVLKTNTMFRICEHSSKEE